MRSGVVPPKAFRKPPYAPAGGLELGYARVSTTKQSLERDLDALADTGLPDERIYVDTKTGATVDRPGLTKLLEYARPGHTVVAYTRNRLGRNLREVLNLVHDLGEKGIGVRTLADPTPFRHRRRRHGPPRVPAPGAVRGNVTHLAERAAHARAVAESRGRHIGRPAAWPDDKIGYARLPPKQGNSLGEITSKTGIPKTSLHCHLTPTAEQE
ncbi:recombinase family protein [Nocardia implantans]|uniref:recombinase family protein n=1 Tax=Nocardia TaxID=1817 RepID=UPI00338EA36F